jgi:colicin import membrane protein
LIVDKYNIIPVVLAGIFHVLILGGLVIAIDFSEPAYPAVPLAITATLVSEEDLPAPPPVDMPEPVAATPEQDRLRAEEIKLQADMQEEQKRIRLQDEADRKRREAADAERKRLREEEVERRRQEAERKRLEDLERQRQENLRLRREAEAAEVERRRRSEIEAEDNRLRWLNANDTTRWVFALQRQIAQNFILPESAPENLECVVDIRQRAGGRVLNVEVGRCNGDESVRRAIEAAVFKASPLPSPDNPSVFDRDLQITFKPEQ